MRAQFTSDNWGSNWKLLMTALHLHCGCGDFLDELDLEELDEKELKENGRPYNCNGI